MSEMIEFPNELTIEVKQEHIDAAAETPSHKPRCCTCPIALAVQGAFSCTKVTVGLSDLAVFADGFSKAPTSYFLPREARTFIGQFDNGFPVQPFTFTAKQIR